jgi:hypothetical protein
MKIKKIKTMKKLLYISLFALSALANLKGQTVSYRITEDDPHDIKNLTIAVDPMFVDANFQNGYSAGWGLRAEYTYGKKITASFDFRNAFGTNGFDPDSNNTRNYSAFEGKIGYVLSDKSRSTNFRIILSQSSYSSGGYTYTSTKSFMCPGTARNSVVFNAGIVQINNNFKYGDSANNAGFTFKSSSRTVKTGDSLWKAYNFSNKYGGFSMISLTAGFTFRKIHNLFVDVDGYGPRANSVFSDFYIDFMFAPVMTMKNYKYDRSGENFDVKAEKKRAIGWRMGWFIRRPKNQGFSQKFEFGQRPGISTPKYLQGCYMMYTFGLYIPLKIGPNGSD